MMGQWERDIKETKLIEFQQWIWAKIPTEEEEEWRKPFSTNVNTLKSRRRRTNKKLREKKDYENYLKYMRERIRKQG